MARYIEYDTESGHIISELKADSPPEIPDGISLLEIEDDAEIEIGRYIVQDGKLKKIYETNAEKSEQERIKKEYSESARARVRCMVQELCIALLEDDQEEIGRLRQEYQSLRVYL